MNPELIDKIYESCFTPQVWPEVLDEVGRIGDAPGASLFFSRGGDQRCVTSPEPRERAERIVREGWLARGAIIARLGRFHALPQRGSMHCARISPAAS